MSDDLKPFVARLADGDTLSAAEARSAFETIMSGAANEAQIAAFLMALRLRGETVDEIFGAAQVMREKALGVEAPAGSVDTCGTGGDAKGTYNVSTAVAFVVAACGIPVAKHGNRAVTSKSGGSQVLEALGVKVDLDPPAVRRCLDETGLGFLFAPMHHSAMRHVAPVRQALGMRTIFNILGPLANPAKAKRQLLGVFSERWLEPLAEVLAKLGSERVWVVHGSDGLDELTVTGESAVAEFDGKTVRRFTVTPEEAGLARHPLTALVGGGPDENAAALKALLDGARGAYRDIVLLNAAAVLVIAEKAPDLADGVRQATAALDDGRAAQVLGDLVRISQEAGS